MPLNLQEIYSEVKRRKNHSRLELSSEDWRRIEQSRVERSRVE